ncbi:hypothetical protein GWI33_019898 [Rhynchophorus ferrugineus]|uniref:Uncharacterized protein n=1 Tax=Rhynchophorus ferrugineus TaxID=354439 RepID=A0A834M0Y1_RHYFE|nr:hypothetical protein GWI33_019898 [Rhynchophorus ferrugineus]
MVVKQSTQRQLPDKNILTYRTGNKSNGFLYLLLLIHLLSTHDASAFHSIPETLRNPGALIEKQRPRDEREEEPGAKSENTLFGSESLATPLDLPLRLISADI